MDTGAAGVSAMGGAGVSATGARVLRGLIAAIVVRGLIAAMEVLELGATVVGELETTVVRGL